MTSKSCTASNPLRIDLRVLRGFACRFNSDPCFIELRMLHALSPFDKVAVDRVQMAVSGLDDRGIVIGSARLIFQVASDRPGMAFVLGEGDRQAIAALGGVVVD